MSIFTKYVPYEKSVHETRNVTSHEHRAPTDESVRLLREMEDKARDSVFATLRCEDSGFTCTAIVFEDHMTRDFTVQAKFTLGEKHHVVSVEVSFDKIYRGDAKENLALVVRDLIAKEVANVITINAWKDSWSLRKTFTQKT